MHPYSKDFRYELTLQIALAFVAVVLTALTKHALHDVLQHIPPEIADWFELSVILFYGLLHWAWDEHLWKLFRFVPNLTGTWEGKVTTPFLITPACPHGEMDAKLTIRQTWSHIHIQLQTKWQESDSAMATLRTHAVTPKLIYECHVRNKHGAPKEVQEHDAVARVMLIKGAKRDLHGDFYMSVGIDNSGGMKLQEVR